MRRSRVAVAAVLVAWGCASCAAPAEPPVSTRTASQVSMSPPAAEPARPAGGAGRYVALGSSMASGPGLAPIVDERCQRSGANYPHRVAAALALELTDVSCGGATTDNVLTTPQEQAGVGSPQLDAVTADTAVVTITVGGNDIGYGSTLDRYGYGCVGASGCPPVPPDLSATDRDLAAVTERLVTVLERIADRAPGARVLVVTYPTIIPPGGGSCPVAPFPAEVAGYLRAVGDRLDAATRDAAARGGAEVVDAYRAARDLGACEPDRPWVTGLPPGDAPAGTLSFHPTGPGMAGVADLVLRALRG